MLRRSRSSNSCRSSASNKDCDADLEKVIGSKCTLSGVRCCVMALFLVFSVLCGLYLLPSKIDPILFSFSGDKRFPVFEDSLAVNNVLKNGKRILEDKICGPECLTKDSFGNVYTGLADGRIVKLSSDLLTFETIIQTGENNDSLTCGNEMAEKACGRPLGMEFDPDNSNVLYVADGSIGLLKVDVVSKKLVVLLETEMIVSVQKLTFMNDLLLLPNGTILISESSFKHNRVENRYEVLEGRSNGRVLYYNLLDESYGVLISDLHFANGICLSHDKSTVLIAETTRARIMRYYLTGVKAGDIEIFMENLPGLPDNISPSSNNGYWIGFALVRRTFLDYMANTTLGKLFRVILSKWLYLLYLIECTLPKHALIVEVDDYGKVLRSFHDKGGTIISATSHILDMQDYLLVGSYFENFFLQLEHFY